jgi:hypothetical protein
MRERKSCSLYSIHHPSEFVRHIEGLAKNAGELHQDHFEEYLNMSTDEKTAMVKAFSDLRTRNQVLRRDTPRAKIQDVANIVCNMKMLVRGTVENVHCKLTSIHLDGWAR